MDNSLESSETVLSVSKCVFFVVKSKRSIGLKVVGVVLSLSPYKVVSSSLKVVFSVLLSKVVDSLIYIG